MLRGVLTISLLVLVASSARACPVFDGRFDCATNDGRKFEMEIHTRVENSISIYDFKTSSGHNTERSDGRMHHVDHVSEAFDVNSKGYCDGDTFIYESSWSKVSPRDSAITKVQFRKTMKLDKTSIVQEAIYSDSTTVSTVCQKHEGSAFSDFVHSIRSWFAD